MSTFSMAQYARSLDIAGKEGAFYAAAALYWYCSDHHGGQNDQLYRILSELSYTPASHERGPDPGSVESIIYADLVSGVLNPEDVAKWIDIAYMEGES